MRRHLFGVVAVLTVLLAALPFSAAATEVHVARISATSYTDTAGSETNSLCATPTGEPAPIETTVSDTASSELLGSFGSGTLTIVPSGGYVQIVAAIAVQTGPLTLNLDVPITCLTPGYAFFTVSVPGQITENGQTYDVVVTITGTIADGVHPNQGRLSMYMSFQAVD